MKLLKKVGSKTTVMDFGKNVDQAKELLKTDKRYSEYTENGHEKIVEPEEENEVVEPEEEDTFSEEKSTEESASEEEPEEPDYGPLKMTQTVTERTKEQR